MVTTPFLSSAETGGFWLTEAQNAGVAQLVEHLSCKQEVIGSNPISGSAKALRVQGFRTLSTAIYRAAALAGETAQCANQALLSGPVVQIT
jgi:hypothetical protein